MFRFLVAATVLVCLSTGISAQARLFGIDGSNLLELDPTNGAVMTTTPLSGGSPGIVSALAYDAAADTLYLASTSQDNLWTIDYTTGATTLVGAFNVGATVVMHGLEIDDAGQLYGYSGFGIALGARFFTIDKSTGQAAPISDPGIDGGVSMGFDTVTHTMYLGDQTGDQLWTLDRVTGVATLVGPYGAAAVAAAPQIGTGMAFHPQHGMYAVNNSGQDSLWSLDLATGTATLVGNLPTSNMLSLAFVDPSPPSGQAFCFGDGSGTPCPCGNASPAGANAGCLSSLGTGGVILAGGNPSLSGDTIVLSGNDMPNSSALYFQGTMQLSGGAGLAFGDGIRCVAGTIIRLGTTTNVAGASQYPFGASPPVSVRGAIGVPGTRGYQVWYRNAAAFCTAATFNLTNGWEIAWTP